MSEQLLIIILIVLAIIGLIVFLVRGPWRRG